MPDTYVLVHGAWHTGAELEPAAEHLRADGHIVYCPTVAGNRAGDDRSTVGLEQAIASIIAFLEENDLRGRSPGRSQLRRDGDLRGR
jgi:hypothetical protein